MTEQEKSGEAISYLRAGTHDNLIRSISFISKQTNIPESYLRFKSAREYCTENELKWVQDVRKRVKRQTKETIGGMIIYGKPDNLPMAKKMLAIGATLVRNFVDVRVFTITKLLSMLDDRYADTGYQECSVLIIPDLCTEGFDVPTKQIHKLYGFLLQRFVEDKLVIGYVDSMSAIEDNYGSTFYQQIKEHYDLFDGTLATEIEAAV